MEIQKDSILLSECLFNRYVEIVDFGEVSNLYFMKDGIKKLIVSDNLFQIFFLFVSLNE